MHSNANDFVIIDCRNISDSTNIDYGKIAQRRTGIGCDQVVTIRRSTDADCTMIIHNADGSQAGMCGNAAICVGQLLMNESGSNTASIEVGERIVVANKTETGGVRVNMGKPRLAWQDIPVAIQCDTLSIPLSIGTLPPPAGVSMGNPHVVFFVKSVADCNLEAWGPIVENHPLFPQRTNVCVGQAISRDNILLRVWERGVGETHSCGSGTCATLVAGVRLGLTNRCCTVNMPGGALFTEWQASGDTVISGRAIESFRGVLSEICKVF
ncbi:MAG: diaminopimelate epimerase [Anaplasma sp.]